jgi:hypothetical protein
MPNQASMARAKAAAKALTGRSTEASRIGPPTIAAGNRRKLAMV